MRPAFIWHPKLGAFSGHLKKIKGRWWFFGNVCKDVKGRLTALKKNGYTLRE